MTRNVLKRCANSAGPRACAAQCVTLPRSLNTGFHSHQAARQRYQCQTCQHQFDDLSGTVFEGHHQPLRVWVLCLYFMGLNLSNQQIAAELELNPSDVHGMTTQLREGIVKKKAA